MKRFIIPLVLVAMLPCAANAQTTSSSSVVQTCGTLPSAYVAGTTRPDTVDVNGNKCTNGTGGGGGAVYGPTAVGSAAANPPVLAGGTADGTATGNVGVLKIVSGVGSVNTAQVNGVTALTGAGATGTGSLRTTVAQDATTMAGSPIPATAYQGNVTSTKVAANASPTILRSYMLYNGNTAVCYLQFFNLASANVTVGSTAPAFFIGVPANGGANFALVYNFSVAMTIAATTTATGSTNCTNGIDTSLIQN